MTEAIREKVEKAVALLEELSALAENALLRLNEDDMEFFEKIINERKKKFDEFLRLREILNQEQPAAISPLERIEINQRISLKIENFTKVDEKVFDIMKYRQVELTEKMGMANQGKNFLKRYKKQVNSRNIFYRML